MNLTGSFGFPRTSTRQISQLLIRTLYASRFPWRETAGVSAESPANASRWILAGVNGDILQRYLAFSFPEVNTISR